MARGELLAHHDAHAAADEAVFHRRDHAGDAVDGAGADEQRVFMPGGLAAGDEAGARRAWCR